jgi:elongation factor P
VAATDLRAGMLLEDGGKLLEIKSATHTAGKARQAGNVALECKDVRTGVKTRQKLASDKSVLVAETQWRKMQYLYDDEDGVHVMDLETFEQYSVPKVASTGIMNWLQEGLEVSALMYEGAPAVLDLPGTQLTVKVVDTTEARVSVASNKKSAVVNTGATVMVPSFVQAGDAIVVNPASGEFLKRASS